MRRSMIWLAAVAAMAGCVDASAPVETRIPPSGPAAALPQRDPVAAAHSFVEVVSRMEPVIERECRQRAPAAGCDFTIAVDDRPGLPPNAYQTLDRAGGPVIAFTPALIYDARNPDELAFIIGHEAAHHIEAHIPRQRQNALTGALALGAIAAMNGADAQAVEQARSLGAGLGARAYSKDFELEADSLGTYLAWIAGYDPEIGAQFFTRIPDPGNAFLGTHPPNAARLAEVQATLRRLRGY
ncbi:MAG: M48 family metalloprotease [Pseudomonadota bacterium]